MQRGTVNETLDKKNRRLEPSANEPVVIQIDEYDVGGSTRYLLETIGVSAH